MEPAPVAPPAPRPGFLWMHAADVSVLPAPHEVVQALEGLAGALPTEVVRPAASDRVELLHYHLDTCSLQPPPFLAEAGLHRLDRLLAGCDQHLVSGSCGPAPVLPNGKAQEVEALGEVDDAGLLPVEGQPAFGQPGIQLFLGSRRVLSTLAEHHQVIGVADQGPRTDDLAPPVVPDTEG